MTVRWVVLAFALALRLPVGAQTLSLQPYKTLNLQELLPAAQGSAPSIEFVSDNSVALCIHTKDGGCLISIVTWNEDDVHTSGSTLAVNEQLIGRAGGDHIFATSLTYPTSSLYSISSQTLRSIPFVRRNLTSATGHLAAATTDNNWTLYTLVPQVQQIGEGKGMLLSVSEGNLAMRHGDKITVQTVNGNTLGSFKVKPQAKCFTDVMLVKDALFLNSCNANYIVSWSGRRLLKIDSLTGNPRLMATDAGGIRLLLDYSTRNISVLQSAGELAVTVASLGAGAPDQFDNGEAVRVIDTTTGAVCFQWQTRLSTTDAFFSHASLAPSGKFVAVGGSTAVSVFRLPESCAAR